MMTHGAWRPLSIWLLVAGLWLGASPSASSEVCDVPAAIGIDPARADTDVFVYLCRGYGQVFLAADTLIQSISIWRPGGYTVDGRPRLLFITETVVNPRDSRVIPDVHRVLLNAGLVVNLLGDGIHPAEYRWVFDPPFALPHRGKFFFDILASEGSSWLIPAVTSNPYPDGQAFWTGPALYCTPGFPDVNSPPNVDLAFEVRFCTNPVTPTRQEPWGRLKVLYR
jgi:hypothetical protein